MAEYLDREALIAEFKQLKLGESSFIERVFADGVYAIIERFPAADVAPSVHARWIVTKAYNDVIDMDVSKYTCSSCGEYRLIATTLSQATNYCPNCGAKMDIGE